MFTLSHQELERFETWPAYPSPMRRLVQRQTWQEEELNAASDELREMYLETIKNCLCDSFHFDRASAARRPVTRRFSWSLKGLVRLAAAAALKKQGIGLYHEANPDDPHSARWFRENGKAWPECAETMIGLKRMDNLKQCGIDVMRNNVPGDFIETGVWRGGATILMRAIIKAFGDRNRTVWVADSFEGLPKPNIELYPADARDIHHMHDDLRISIEQVQANFAKYGLLDQQVQFLKGWFKDTLPTAPIEKLAVLRLDGDMYESTMDAFKALYHKLSPGGYCIIDDYHAVKGCKAAVHDFRNERSINDPILEIDGTGVYWQKRV